MRIHFARHGESLANQLHVISNRGLVHGLTLEGRQQALGLAHLLEDRPISRVYTSPLLRAIETGVLVANHAPFTWGKNAHDSVKNAVVLEEVAAMALGTLTISPDQPPISQAILDKHYGRKHGKDAYYGQD